MRRAEPVTIGGMRLLNRRPVAIAYWFVAAVLSVFAGVAAGTVMQQPVYRASGMVELRGQSGEGMPAEALFQAARLSNQFLGTQYGVLRSEALARRGHFVSELSEVRPDLETYFLRLTGRAPEEPA